MGMSWQLCLLAEYQQQQSEGETTANYYSLANKTYLTLAHLSGFIAYRASARKKRAENSVVITSNQSSHTYIMIFLLDRK